MNVLLAAVLNGGLTSAAMSAILWFALRRRLNAATRYVIWWVMLGITLLLPAAFLPPPASRAAVHKNPRPVERPVSVIAPVEAPIAMPEVSYAVATFPAQVESGHWLAWFLWFWAASSVLLLARLVVASIVLERRKAHATPAPDWLARKIPEWSGRRRVTVGISREIDAPMAAGPWSPTILIPERMLSTLSETELGHIGLHEAAHLARRDDYAILVQRLIEAIFCLHPVVRFITRRVELEREIACDDLVVAGSQNPRAYALCLTHIAEMVGATRGKTLAAGVVEERSHLSLRVDALLDRTRHQGIRLLKVRFAITVAALALGGWVGSRNPAVVAFAQSLPIHIAQARSQVPTAAKAVQPPVTKPALSSQWGGVSVMANFPVYEALGKHVHFSGYIKTDGVTDGFAGLRWMVRDQSDALLVAANTDEHGATGTTGWQRYDLELTVPANAYAIYFGVGQTGKGTAWFDSLAVELDGKPYTGQSLFDLDFEAEKTGFQPWGSGYGVASDDGVFHTGKRSLRIDYGGQLPMPSFGVATGTFPVEAAAGKHIRFSGYIKTENVIHGTAGLWWRVDGSDGKTLAFENLGPQRPNGTSDWTRYEINVDVPPQANNINFGATLLGEGTAWFDSFQVEADGVPYRSDAMDLDFESPTPVGFGTGGFGYGVQLDRDVFHSGHQSLRMRYGAAPVAYPDSLRQLSSATANFPAGDAVGKRVRFSAYIKTKDVIGGADLFWRVYRGRVLVAYRTLIQPPAGTTDWTRYEFVIGIPTETTRIEFGTELNGTGTVWFDSMEVDLDGVPYKNSPAFDLDFESTFPNLGFRPNGDGYWIRTDNEIFHTGRQSLRMEKQQ